MAAEPTQWVSDLRYFHGLKPSRTRRVGRLAYWAVLIALAIVTALALAGLIG